MDQYGDFYNHWDDYHSGDHHDDHDDHDDDDDEDDYCQDREITLTSRDFPAGETRFWDMTLVYNKCE